MANPAAKPQARKPRPQPRLGLALKSLLLMVCLTQSPVWAQTCDVNNAASFATCQRLAPRDPGAASDLGYMYSHGIGIAKDEIQAVFWYRKAAEQGNAIAQYNLGLMYYNGRGIAKDEAQAVYWYRKAAEQGGASAQYNLGVMYDKGQGIAKDEAQAVYWYRKAAEQGNASAQNNLGTALLNGKGVAKNQTEALSWFRKAAEQGDVVAQDNLARCYEVGWGTPRDLKQAVHWYQKAAQQGDRGAMNRIAQAYAAGIHLPKDPATARAWFYKSVEYDIRNDKFCQDIEKTKESHLQACYIHHRDYALALETGLGGPPDPAEAQRIYGIVVRDYGHGQSLDTPLWPEIEKRKKDLSDKDTRLGAALPPRQARGDGPTCGDASAPSERFEPKPTPGAPYTRTFEVAVLIESDDKQHLAPARQMLQGAADILAGCGIQLKAAKIALKVSEACNKEFIFEHTPAIPIVMELGKSESPGANNFRVQMYENTSPEALAHELGHMLGSVNHPADFEPSIMNYSLLFAANPRFTEAQCRVLRQSARLMSASNTPTKPNTTGGDALFGSLQRLASRVTGGADDGKPEAFKDKQTLGQIIAYLAPLNKFSAAFYYLRDTPSAHPSYIHGKPHQLPTLARALGISASEVMKLYEHAHDWRGDQGWVTEKTTFDLKSPPDLFWAPEVTVASLEEKIREDRARSLNWVSTRSPEEGAMNPAHRLTLKPGDRFPVSDQPNRSEFFLHREVFYEDYPVNIEWWLRGNNLYEVSKIAEERRVLSITPDFMLLWQDNNLDAVLKHPRYQARWEDPAADPPPQKLGNGQRPPPRNTLTNSAERKKDKSLYLSPASLPGAKIISAHEAWRAILAGQRGQLAPPLVITYRKEAGLPTRYIVDLSQLDKAYDLEKESLDDTAQAALGTAMASLAPDKNRMVIVYGDKYQNSDWNTYNLAVRLIALGYSNVHFFRGAASWREAGLPLSLTPRDGPLDKPLAK